MKRRTFLTITTAGMLAPWQLRADDGDIFKYVITNYSNDHRPLISKLLKDPIWRWELSVIGQRNMIKRMYAGFNNSGFGGSSEWIAKLDYYEQVVKLGGWNALISRWLPRPVFQYPPWPIEAQGVEHATEFSDRHMNVALSRWKQVEMIYRAFFRRKATPIEAGLAVHSMSRLQAPVRIALTKSAAHANELTFDPILITPDLIISDPLDPVVVTASQFPGGLDGYIGSLHTFINNTPGWSSLYPNWDALLAAHNESLRQPPPPPPPVVPVTNPFMLSPETQEQFFARLEKESIPRVQREAVWKVFGAALSLMGSGAIFIRAGASFIGTGLAAGTIGMKIAFVGAGSFTIVVVGVPMVLLGFGLIHLTWENNAARGSGVMLPMKGTPEAEIIP